MKRRRDVLAGFAALAAGAGVVVGAGLAPAAEPAAVADEALVALACDGLAAHQRWLSLLSDAGRADEQFLAARAAGLDTVDELDDACTDAREAEQDGAAAFHAIVGRAIAIRSTTARGVVAKAALLWLADFDGAEVEGEPWPQGIANRLACSLSGGAFALLGFKALQEGGAS